MTHVARVRYEGLEQLVVVGPAQGFKCWKVLRQEATTPQPCNQPLQPGSLLSGGKHHHAGEAYTVRKR